MRLPQICCCPTIPSPLCLFHSKDVKPEEQSLKLDIERLQECIESERYGASMPENIVDAAIEMIKQRGRQLDRWQEESEKRMADQRRNLCAESDALIEQLKKEREASVMAFESAAFANKTYRKIEAEMSQLHDAGIKAWNSAIDSVLALYVPDGNPDVWARKVEGLRQNENMPQLVKEPDTMGICPACGANTDSWHFCHDYGTWR
jgi:hypothetical protein